MKPTSVEYCTWLKILLPTGRRWRSTPDILAARLMMIGTAATVGTLLLTADLLRSFTVMLVMACPCATVLASSTAITAAIANAARNHTLVKGGLYLEMVGKADCFCFDKTGTLTTDVPRVVEVVPRSAKR